MHMQGTPASMQDEPAYGVTLIIPMIRGVERFMILPPRFNERFFENSGVDVEKFFMDSREVEPIFCKFGN